MCCIYNHLFPYQNFFLVLLWLLFSLICFARDSDSWDMWLVPYDISTYRLKFSHSGPSWSFYLSKYFSLKWSYPHVLFTKITLAQKDLLYLSFFVILHKSLNATESHGFHFTLCVEGLGIQVKFFMPTSTYAAIRKLAFLPPGKHHLLTLLSMLPCSSVAHRLPPHCKYYFKCFLIL